MDGLDKFLVHRQDEGNDRSDLPSLLSGIKKIPIIIVVSWFGVVLHEVFLTPSSEGKSLVSLAVFLTATFTIIPILTYVAAYTVSPLEVKEAVRAKKISSYMRVSGIVMMLVVSFSLLGLLSGVSIETSHVVIPALFVFVMMINWIKFARERSLLAKVRDSLLKDLFSEHRNHQLDDMFDINPVNGIPMLNSAIDVQGNARGTQANVTHEYSEGNINLTDVGSYNSANGLPMFDSFVDIQNNAWGSSGNNFHEDTKY
ncbi:hypothetical protein NG99_07135 [Erwinia typographi]|uniref:Uncharacterized protein n=1 Tax=Erwinia typographi TaxID=371042 RepID=A0A0A3Z6N9_9GAMM|nr:hypothetical protein [Erwinia typographi]KGT94757.1 hypothetical protein NG99_07135 [Erwinia typographi]